MPADGNVTTCQGTDEGASLGPLPLLAQLVPNVELEVPGRCQRPDGLDAAPGGAGQDRFELERCEQLDQGACVTAASLVERPLSVVSHPGGAVTGPRVANQEERHQPNTFDPRLSTVASAAG